MAEGESEDLLKFIQEPAEKDSAEKTGTAPKPKKGFSLSGLFSSKKGKEKKSGGKDSAINAVLNTKFWNRILVALIVASLIYLVLDLTILKFDQSKFLAQVGTTEAVYPIFDEETLGKVNDAEYYLGPISKRNPFLSPSAVVSEEVETTETFIPKPQTQRMAEIIDGLKVVGISWEKGEPVVMIEDSTTTRTYFARKGQVIRGAEVSSITKEKVTLTYEGEEASLV